MGISRNKYVPIESSEVPGFGDTDSVDPQPPVGFAFLRVGSPSYSRLVVVVGGLTASLILIPSEG